MKAKTQFKGYIQVYTGDGKGKTTAALGLALRAAGYKHKVYIGQFLKGQEYGELSSVKKTLTLRHNRTIRPKGFYPRNKRSGRGGYQKSQERIEEMPGSHAFSKIQNNHPG